MSEHNHRRISGPSRIKFRKEVLNVVPMREDVIYRFGHSCSGVVTDGMVVTSHLVPSEPIENGDLPKFERPWQGVRNRNKFFGDRGILSGVSVGAHAGYEHSDGHRGEAKAVRGAKKFVRSRIRFHENAATRRLLEEVNDDE